MGKYLDIAKKFMSDQEGVALVEPVVFEEVTSHRFNSELVKAGLLDHLTRLDREVFNEYVEVMTSNKFKMSLPEAEEEATRLMVRIKQAQQIQQARKDYDRFGYIKIFSTVLNQAIYLARDKRVAKRVPDISLAAFTESELECFRGLEPNEAKLLMEGKIILGGTVQKEGELDKLKDPDNPVPVRRKKRFKRNKGA